MKIDYQKLAGIINVPVRLATGIGVGVFVKTVGMKVAKDMSIPGRVMMCIGTICTTWAACYAVDSWCNEAVKSCAKWQNFQEMAKEWNE